MSALWYIAPCVLKVDVLKVLGLFVYSVLIMFIIVS
jgi:hypothetical protein